MDRRITSVIVLSAVLLLAGCTPQFDHIESSLARNSDELEQARVQQRQLAQEVAGLSTLLRQEDNSGLENNARLQARLVRVENKVDQVIRMLEDNFEFMQGISARVDLLATRLGIPTLGEYKTPRGGDVSALSDLPEEGRAVFNAAMLDRSRGDLDAAKEGLRDFLDRFGNSEMADDALYWLGAISMAGNDHAAALGDFARLLEDWPQAERRADAMLKSLVAERALGNDEAARDWLERLRADYPGSEITALAEEEFGAQAD